MPTTTELLVCPLSAGSDIGDQQNEAAKVLKEVGGTLKTTDGVQQIQFGTTVEKPDVFELHVGKSTSFSSTGTDPADDVPSEEHSYSPSTNIQME